MPTITEPCGVCEGECKHKDLMTEEALKQQQAIEAVPEFASWGHPLTVTPAEAYRAFVVALHAAYRPVPMEPAIVWTKPLTPCGPEEDPLQRLLGRVSILGISHHAEAFEVDYMGEEGCQAGKQDESETYLPEILEIVQGAASTITIGGREYVFAITPTQR